MSLHDPLKIREVSAEPVPNQSVKALFLSPRMTAHSLHFVSILWGFVESDLFTFAVPNTVFGILSALAAPALQANPDWSPIPPTPSSHPNLSLLGAQHILKPAYQHPSAHILQNLPAVLIFNLINLFIFDAANQRSPESVAEDRINKPWRPIPCGKITMEQTRRLMLAAVPTVLAINYLLGVWKQGVLILILTWLYNDLGGGDEVLVRELVIAVAYGLFNHGSLAIAASNSNTGSSVWTNGPQAIAWIGIISGVILTTMQVQDLKDMEGDRSRGRRTIPLFFGEGRSRMSISFFVCFWSWLCAYFWRLSLLEFAAHIGIAAVVAWRVVWVRSGQREDARTWKFWCLWHASLYVLPLLGLYGRSI